MGGDKEENVPPRVDLTGKVFGKLIVLEFAYKVEGTSTLFWKCQCQCGNETCRNGKSLRSGLVKSCGCLVIETMKLRATHGMSAKKVYQVHCKMKARCDDPNDKSYVNYGGRGISYDPLWKNFQTFWDDMGSTYMEGLTLDRVNVNGNYCKENCRWTARSQQAQGTRKRKDKWTSKYKGVALQPSGMWVAQIQKEFIVHRAGPFANEEDAARGYDKMAIELYGETATTNLSLGILETCAVQSTVNVHLQQGHL